MKPKRHQVIKKKSSLEISSMSSPPSELSVYPFRLTPGMEIVSSLEKFVSDNNLQAPFVMTCCGSVTKAELRFSYPGDGNGKNQIRLFEEHMEITSLVGTVGIPGSHFSHLHVTLGRKDGTAIAGHVMGQMRVYTTAEIVLGDCKAYKFNRPIDPATGYDELEVQLKK